MQWLNIDIPCANRSESPKFCCVHSSSSIMLGMLSPSSSAEFKSIDASNSTLLSKNQETSSLMDRKHSLYND